MRLRVIDIETCGLEPPAAVCEIGWADVVSTATDLAGAPTGWEDVAGTNFLSIWNDEPYRTQADVVALFDRTIAIAKAEASP